MSEVMGDVDVVLGVADLLGLCSFDSNEQMYKAATAEIQRLQRAEEIAIDLIDGHITGYVEAVVRGDCSDDGSWCSDEGHYESMKDQAKEYLTELGINAAEYEGDVYQHMRDEGDIDDEQYQDFVDENEEDDDDL